MWFFSVLVVALLLGGKGGFMFDHFMYLMRFVFYVFVLACFLGVVGWVFDHFMYLMRSVFSVFVVAHLLEGGCLTILCIAVWVFFLY